MHEMLKLAIPAWQIALRSAAIYVALFVGLRVFGKREVGQFTIFDLVLILLIANAVQPAMTGPDSSLTGGLIIIGVLLALNYVVGRVLPRSQRIRRLLQPHPTVIAQDGQWLPRALAREGMDVEEGETAIREHGLMGVSDVQLAVLEPDGSVSVVPKDSTVLKGRRRRSRYDRRP